MRPAAGAFLLLMTAVTAASQVQAPPQKTTIAGVLIDVSVLDRSGQPVLDLTGNDFELTEDGVRQRIVSVTLVQAGAHTAINAAPQGPAPQPAPSATHASSSLSDTAPTVTAILFDRLSPEARPLAHKAAMAYVGTLTPPSDRAGVFLADLSLRTIQPFTNQPERVREGVDRVSGIASANARQETQRAGDIRIQGLDPTTPLTGNAEYGANFVNSAEKQRILASMNPVDRIMAEMMLRMEESYHRFLSEYEGQASIAGLRAVISAMRMLPGRKSVLYFTENLPLSTTLKPKFDALIGQANRANVTVYPVDAAGLRAQSKEAELARKMSVAGARGLGDERRRDGAWTKDIEQMDDDLSSRPAAVLGRLAKETGGFLVENTNDLTKGVARMQQERTTYYLLGYQPTKPLDGTYRRVNVKVKRQKTTVSARLGYLAVE